MKRIIFIAIASLFLLYSSLFLPKTHIVYNYEEMKTIDFGYPFSFVTQDFSKYNPPFPWHYNYAEILPYENPIKINNIRFIFSYLIIFIIIFILDYLFRKFLHKKDEGTQTTR